MKEIKRLITAVFMSTLCVVPLYFFLTVITGDLKNDLLPAFLIAAPMFALVGVILVGLPTHFFLSWRRMTKSFHYWVPGFVIPALFVLTTKLFGEDGVLWILFQSFLMGLFGAIVALVFRYFALKGKIIQ